MITSPKLKVSLSAILNEASTNNDFIEIRVKERLKTMDFRGFRPLAPEPSTQSTPYPSRCPFSDSSGTVDTHFESLDLKMCDGRAGYIHTHTHTYIHTNKSFYKMEMNSVK